jgi:hypothetical protein
VKELKKLKLLVRQRRLEKRGGRYNGRFISAVAVFETRRQMFYRLIKSGD